VAVRGRGIVGCGSLRVYTPALAEVCALAVAEPMQGRGLGRALVESIMEEAERAGIRQLFALTLEERFFNRLGFRTGRIAEVPEKVWADCEGCPVRNACREIMVVRELGPAR
jgi:amino-acid N-acetyltransferase